jgi:hypothetical protein
VWWPGTLLALLAAMGFRAVVERWMAEAVVGRDFCSRIMVADGYCL